MAHDPPSFLPYTVVHADWSLHPDKRWMARATLRNGRYRADAPEPVDDPATLLERIRTDGGGDASAMLGFDFPIGVPKRYAERAGITSFTEMLPEFGEHEWRDFYEVAESPEEIGVRRPFYPRRPGGTKMSHLLDGLSIESTDDLSRRCDREYEGRPAAAPIFWTMGAKQVGKAAISGWREVLAPALRDPTIAIWPFDGGLRELLEAGNTVLAETYPAEFYRHLGVKLGSKRVRGDRASNAGILIRWAEKAGVELSSEMLDAICGGFGSSADGEDRFDASVGLFGMLGIVLGHRPSGEPPDDDVQKIEGWMLGQNASPGVEGAVRPR